MSSGNRDTQTRPVSFVLVACLCANVIAHFSKADGDIKYGYIKYAKAYHYQDWKEISYVKKTPDTPLRSKSSRGLDELLYEVDQTKSDMNNVVDANLTVLAAEDKSKVRKCRFLGFGCVATRFRLFRGLCFLDDGAGCKIASNAMCFNSPAFASL